MLVVRSTPWKRGSTVSTTVIVAGVGTALRASETSFCTSPAVTPGCMPATDSETALATSDSISSLVAPGWAAAATASLTIC